MKIESLEAHDVPSEVLAIWRAQVGDALLPVQTRAVRAGVFSGQSLVVLAPTSSGKTFVGEMAAVRLARADRRVLFLVPLKAVAEEKHRQLVQRYESLGMRVVLSTRDHRTDDGDLEAGCFDIAVVVFEKLERLLVTRPGILDGVGLVVMDELQLLADPARGPAVELLLTRLRRVKQRPQFLGLSAVLTKAEPLARWLGAELVVEEERPVELRKGVVCGGRFLYREHNTGHVDTEDLGAIDTKDRSRHLAATVSALATTGSVLVFVPDRVSSRQTAELLASALPLPAAQAALLEVPLLEEGMATDTLGRTLQHGVAFHNADLTADQRDLVERHFRSGEIRVVVATSTLAVGVNLPVQHVLVAERWRWRYSQRCDKWSRSDMTPSEFENMAGRAGRLGLSSEHGRALLLAPSPWHQEVWMRTVIDGASDPVRPTLEERPLTDVVLDLVVSGEHTSERQLGAFLLDTYTGDRIWRPQGVATFRRRLVEATSSLLGHGLLRRNSDGKLEPTRLGRIAAERGLAARTTAMMARWAAAAADVPWTALEVLLVAALTPDGQEVYLSFSGKEEGGYMGRFLAEVERLGARDRPLFQWLDRTRGGIGHEEAKGLKKALLLAGWVDEQRTDVLERDHRTWAGAIQHLASDFAWLVDAIVEIATAQAWAPERIAELRELALRLRTGVRSDLLALAQLAVPGLGRTGLRRLERAGLGSAELLRDAELEALATTLRNRPLALKVHAALTVGGSGAAAATELAKPGPAEDPTEHDRRAPEAPPAPPPSSCPADALAALGSPSKIVEAAPMLTRLRIKFTSRYCPRRRRSFVEIEGQEVALTPASFITLLRLVIARQRGPGWLHKVELGARADHGWKGMTRLEKELVAALGDSARKLFEKNYSGCYRLAEEPMQVDTSELREVPHPLPRVAAAVRVSREGVRVAAMT